MEALRRMKPVLVALSAWAVACPASDLDSDGRCEWGALQTTGADIRSIACSSSKSAPVPSPLQIQAESLPPFDALAVAALREHPDDPRPAALAIGFHGWSAPEQDATPGLVSVARIDTGEVLWTLQGPAVP